MPTARDIALDSLRSTLAAAGRHSAWPPIPLGVPALDAALPGGGLARGALHEVAGSGPEVEHAAAAALFVAGILAGDPISAGRPVLWVLPRADLFAPALAGVGLHPDRVIYAEAPQPASVLLALEDALRHPGLAGVVGELSGRFTLTASRRLQLAGEASGVPAFVLRRGRRHDDPALAEPCAAVTRWRIGAVPSPPLIPHAPDVPGLGSGPGLGRARWRLDLIRCRGGDTKSWIVEATNAQGRLGLPAEFPDRSVAPGSRPERRRAAG